MFVSVSVSVSVSGRLHLPPCVSQSDARCCEFWGSRCLLGTAVGVVPLTARPRANPICVLLVLCESGAELACYRRAGKTGRLRAPRLEYGQALLLHRAVVVLRFFLCVCVFAYSFVFHCLIVFLLCFLLVLLDCLFVCLPFELGIMASRPTRAVKG